MDSDPSSLHRDPPSAGDVAGAVGTGVVVVGVAVALCAHVLGSRLGLATSGGPLGWSGTVGRALTTRYTDWEMHVSSWGFAGGPEPDHATVRLYLDYGDDLARVGPILRMWYAEADRLLSGLVRPPGAAKPDVYRSGYEKEPGGSGRKVRPRTWDAGITEDYFQLTWAWRDTAAEASVAELKLYVFRFFERRHVMLSASVDLEDRPGRLPVVLPPLLELLRTVADVADPAYGEAVVNGSSLPPATMLDGALYRHAEDSAAQSREFLRGYEWLTICPKELLPRLGGAEGLRGSNAFSSVEELRHGGALLRATDDPAAYGPAEIAAVFSAVAPVLPAGRPRALPGHDLRRVVFANAGEQTRAARPDLGPGMPAPDDPRVAAAQAFVAEAVSKGWVSEEAADDVIPEHLREKLAGHVKIGLTEEGRRRLEQIMEEQGGTTGR